MITDDELAEWFMQITIEIAMQRGKPLALVAESQVQGGMQLLLNHVGARRAADFLEAEAANFRELAELYPKIFEPASSEI